VNTISRRDFLRTGTAATLGMGLGIGLKRPSFAQEAATPAPSAGQVSGPLDDLRKQLKGTLLLPGDAQYVTAGEPANGRFRDVQPLAIAQCADENDIVTCVKWARANGVPPVARSGGHSEAGYSTTSGLLINAGQLNRVVIDRGQGTAVVGGGAVNNNMLQALENGPLYLPVGTCLAVGVAALTLGGGIGYNAHSAGLTCDHLLSTRIVTATGDVLDVDASNSNAHSDLFWACRGGAGGNFGINTSLTFKLVEVPRPMVAYYRLEWQGADAAAAALAAFHKMLQTAPPALNAVAMAQATPIGNGGPREAIFAFSRGQYIGPIDELRDLIAPLRALKPTKTTIEEMTFWKMQRMFASSDDPTTHSFGDYSRYAAEPIPDDAVGKVIDLLVACPSRTMTANGSIWSLGWIGGDVMNKYSRTDTAYVHRNMLTLLRATPVWENDAPASVGNGLIAWTDAMIAAIAPYTPDESYQNFTNRRIIGWQQAYYAENFQRLVDVKTKYDPTNLFNNFQSIPPRSLL
jgi:FAD/FMN-containing dehydrogenase